MNGRPVHRVSISGIQIIANPHLPETMQFEVRPHTKRQWMPDSYHQRIQKKWRKRFGYEMRPAMIQSDSRIFCHPNIFDKIVKQIREETQNAVV